MNWITNLLKPLARGIAALWPSCRQASRLQSEALDRKLPLLPRAGLWIHLLLCKWCRQYGKQIRFLREAARDRADESAKPASLKLSDAARDRIMRRLRAEED